MADEMTSEVLEPKRPTEFEVQAELYFALRKAGYSVRGEVKAAYPFDGGKKKKACRFDLALFVNGRLAGIIEVKSAKITHKTAGGWAATRQGFRYGRFGVPVRIVYGMADAVALIERVVAGHGIFDSES